MKCKILTFLKKRNPKKLSLFYLTFHQEPFLVLLHLAWLRFLFLFLARYRFDSSNQCLTVSGRVLVVTFIGTGCKKQLPSLHSNKYNLVLTIPPSAKRTYCFPLTEKHPFVSIAPSPPFYLWSSVWCKQIVKIISWKQLRFCCFGFWVGYDCFLIYLIPCITSFRSIYVIFFLDSYTFFL